MQETKPYEMNDTMILPCGENQKHQMIETNPILKILLLIEPVYFYVLKYFKKNNFFFNSNYILVILDRFNI